MLQNREWNYLKWKPQGWSLVKALFIVPRWPKVWINAFISVRLHVFMQYLCITYEKNMGVLTSLLYSEAKQSTATLREVLCLKLVLQCKVCEMNPGHKRAAWIKSCITFETFFNAAPAAFDISSLSYSHFVITLKAEQPTAIERVALWVGIMSVKVNEHRISVHAKCGEI